MYAWYYVSTDVTRKIEPERTPLLRAHSVAVRGCARFPRIVMVLMTCSRVPGLWFYLNAFAHVHYQSYPTRAITPMIICPARIQKHKIQYNAMPFSPLGIY